MALLLSKTFFKGIHTRHKYIQLNLFKLGMG